TRFAFCQTDRYTLVARLDTPVMGDAQTMSAVLTPLPPDGGEPSADRAQSGDAPTLYHDEPQAQLYCGDSGRLLEAIGTRQVNLIITSPPYSLGVDYGQAGYADDQPYATYLD